MWYFSVYATVGAIVILLLSQTESFTERWQGAIRMAETELGPFQDHLVDLVLLFVVVLLLLTWPPLPVSFAYRHFKRRRGNPTR
jgi:hypothetical protein